MTALLEFSKVPSGVLRMAFGSLAFVEEVNCWPRKSKSAASWLLVLFQTLAEVHQSWVWVFAKAGTADLTVKIPLAV